MEHSAVERAKIGLLVTADLIFSTKITGTARAMGLEVEVASGPGPALEWINANRPRCVLLDLGLSILSADQLRAIVEAAAGAAVLAFGSHVDTARLQQARDAGCTEVMPRSRLAETLPQLLASYLGQA